MNRMHRTTHTSRLALLLALLLVLSALAACNTSAPSAGETTDSVAQGGDPTGSDAPDAPTAPSETRDGPIAEPTDPQDTDGPTPEPTAPQDTDGPTPEPTAPQDTDGPIAEPTAPETTVKEPETTVKPPETTVKEPETTVKPPETTVKEPETTAEPTPDPSPSYTRIPLNASATFVKRLNPRMEATAEHITCDWSASGIEFTATLCGDVTFEVHVTAYDGAGVKGCYFRAYVDGEVWKNGASDYYEVLPGDGTVVLKDLPAGTHTVRLVKATGYTLANAELKSVTLAGTVDPSAPAERDFLVEFVGDSISCGWGVVGAYNGAYTAQDATLATPYLIAEALGADLSVVALSGQGIIAGKPGIATGYRYASPYRSKNAEFDFARKAKVVVINADTNDAYASHPTATYLTALGNFVSYVREKNGADTHIVIVCNMMKTNYTAALADFVRDLGGAEARYYYYRAETAAGVHTAHPTAEENRAYAAKLTEMIASILDGTYEEPWGAGGTPTLPTNATVIYKEDFESAKTASEAGVSNLYGGTKAPTVTDGKLSVGKTSWSEKPFFELVDRETLGGEGKYMISLDLDVSELNNLALVLGGTADEASDTSYKRKGAAIVQLKVRKAGSAADLKGAASGFGSDAWIVMRHGYFASTDGTQNVQDGSATYARTVGEGITSLKLNLTVLVDSTAQSGCNVHVFVDGAYVSTCYLDHDYRTTENSSIYLWAENTAVTVEEITVSRVP